jgi:spermidine/putrescine transport system permease protein
MNANRRPAIPLFLYYFILIALLYLPIAVLFLFSVNANTSLSFPMQGLTLDWYRKLFDSAAVLNAARNSLIVAAGSSLAATILGTMVSILYLRFQFRSKGFLIALAVLPLIVPYIVLAISLLLLFSVFHIERSLWTVGISHTVVALPYVVLIVASRLAGFDPTLEEAAMDLGADYPTTLRRVVLPMIFPAIVSAYLTAFTVSFDEFALALFLAGTQPTFPVYLFSQLRFANRLPVMIALAVLLMIGTLTLVFISERIRRVK